MNSVTGLVQKTSNSSDLIITGKSYSALPSFQRALLRIITQHTQTLTKTQTHADAQTERHKRITRKETYTLTIHKM